MSRLSREQLKIIQQRLGVNRIWSFSKMSTFKQCSWSYKLKYIDKLRGKEDSCYTYWGTIAHDIRQGFYDGVYKSNDEMLGKLEEEIAKYLIEDKKELKFPNKNEHEGYFDNLRHYFANCKHIEGEVQNEKVVIAVLEGNGDKYAFQGYMDSFYEENGKYVILDYKTSSINGFTGDKLLDKSQQLMVYAYGLWKQQGIPIEDIVLKFDMMKYCNVSFLLKNGNTKVTRCDRRGWVANLSNQLRKDFEDIPKAIELLNKKVMQLTKKMNAKCRTPEEIELLNAEINDIIPKVVELEGMEYDILEINEMVSQAIDDNNLLSLPQFIQDKYTLSDCIIEVELNKEIIEECVARIIETLESVVEAENGEEHEESFGRQRIEESESYFCNNLCDVRDSCKFYKEYREHLNLFLNGDDENNSDDAILAMLGL